MNPRDFENRFNEASLNFEKERLQPNGLDCPRCWDTGTVWVDVDGFSAWAFCRCAHGKDSRVKMNYLLPVYDYEMERLFRAKQFPVMAFIPSSFDSMKIGIEKKARSYKDDLRMSEKFWSEQK